MDSDLDVVLSSKGNDNNFHADGSGNVCANELSVDEHDAASDARDVHIKTDNREGGTDFLVAASDAREQTEVLA